MLIEIKPNRLKVGGFCLNGESLTVQIDTPYNYVSDYVVCHLTEFDPGYEEVLQNNSNVIIEYGT